MVPRFIRVAIKDGLAGTSTRVPGRSCDFILGVLGLGLIRRLSKSRDRPQARFRSGGLVAVPFEVVRRDRAGGVVVAAGFRCFDDRLQGRSALATKDLVKKPSPAPWSRTSG